MSLYPESAVPTYNAGEQTRPDIAVLADGSYVIAWQSSGQDGPSSWGVYYQRFTKAGVPIGGEFRANTAEDANQTSPHVAATSDGGFIITWDDDSGSDGSSNAVYAQRFDAGGMAQGGNFLVNTYTSNSQDESAVAGYTGGFATVWVSYGNGGDNSYDIYLQRWTNAGAKVGVETLISKTPGAATPQAGQQYSPDIAAAANGNLAIVWYDQQGLDGSSYGVYGRTYNAVAGTFSDTFLVNSTTSGAQYEPSVAMLADGGFVVAWRSDSQDGSSAGVYAQRYDSAGAKAGGEFLVNQTTNGGQYQPNVAALSTGGFVVSWYNDNYDVSGTGTTADVYVREYSETGAAQTDQIKLLSSTNSTESQPVVADLGGGNYVVSYVDAVSGSGSDVVQQVFGSDVVLPRQTDPTLGNFTGSVTFDENLVNTTPQVIQPVVGLTDLDSANFDGGQLDLYYVQYGEATDQLGVRNVGSGPAQIGVAGTSVSFEGEAIGTLSGGSNGSNLIITFNSSATVDAVEALIENLTYASTSQSPAAARTVGIRVSDGDGGASLSNTMTINVTPDLDGKPLVYGESQVNTFTTSTQQEPQIAVLTDGSYVVAWQSYDQDSSSTYGVYAQRFSGQGVAIGGEFRVNTATEAGQDGVHIAALSNGGFVVTWDDASGVDGSGQGVIGQIYNASGVAQGANFVVNTTTSSTQQYSDVAGYAGAGAVAAGFAAVWSSSQAGGSSYDIYLQRFDNSGSKLGAEVRVSNGVGLGTAQTSAQYYPRIASYSNGDLVIVWRDDGANDGGATYGVFGQRYTAATGALSGTFLVNSTTLGNQYEPDVATLSDGGFVVVWRSDSQDGASAGVYGQRYNAAGTKVGGEFLVNESTAGGQYQPAVTGLSTGGFVVSFYNDNYDVSGTGSYSDVYIREYDAAGNAVDGQRRLPSNTATPSNQEYQPAIADLGGGNFVVAYADYVPTADGGNATFEISQQIFGSAAALARQANPQLGDFTGSVTFAENLINVTPQVIDTAVSVTDIDSANFAGGRVDLFYVLGGQTTDQLGVRNQGTGAGQIGVSGANVSFGGVAIGTLVGGDNGSALQVNLLAGATPGAVEALVQNLTYGSTSSSPDATRTVGLRISDGDGGSTDASVLTINVTSDLDGKPLVYGESQVNTFTTSTQQEPQIAVLTDGSYVVAWQSYDQDSSSTYGVYAQRFSGQGVAIGGEFRVNTATEAGQDGAHIAALSNGGFVVTWDDASGVDSSGSGVIGQIYNSAGVAQGANFVVNTTTSSTQAYSDVAGYAGAGAVAAGFAAVWSSSQAGGSSYDIYLQRFDNSGSKLGAEVRVSNGVGLGTAQTSAQYYPRIASYSNGDLVIVWRDDGANDGGATYGVFGQRYTAATGALSGTFLVNTTTLGNQYEPDVATLSDGGFVVVWRSDSQDGASAGVYGQRYNAAGTKVGGEFLVNETTAGGQYQPAVTGLSTGGFVVSFYNDNYDVSGTGSYSDVYIREYDAAGNAVDGQRRLPSNTATVSNVENMPGIADLGGGNFVVVYADYVPTLDGGNATTEISQQIFGSAAALARQANPQLGDFTGSVTFAENLINTTPQVIDAGVSLSDTDSTDFNGGRVDLFYVKGGEATDQLGVRSVGNGPDQIGVSGSTVSFGGVAIGTIVGGNNGANLQINLTSVAASVEAVEALIQNLTYGSTSSSPAASRTVGIRVSDGDGGSSNPSSFTVNVTPDLDGKPLVYGESQINTYAASTQGNPQVAVLSDGSYVVVWQSAGQDGNGDGVYAQRFASNGLAQGNEFRVNTATTGAQDGAHIAALSNGGFVVTWDDASGVDGSGQGVIGQIYNASGVAQGTNFVVNTTTSSTQQYNDVAGYAGAGAVAAGFAAVWSSFGNTGGSSYDIYLQRFDNSGAKLGAEVRVSNGVGLGTAQTGNQFDPRIASYSNGDLVIVWRDDGANDGGATYGVFGQRYTAATGALSGTFLVNTTTLGNQYEPDVATLSDGGFVVVWRSDSQDGASAGVYGQRYNAAGTKVGGEFLVNESTAGGQYQPAVTGLSTGGFVVSFYNDNYDVSGTGSYSDVYIREYDAAGNAVDGQRRLPSNTATPSNQEYQPAIADLGGGNFVVAYADYVPTADGGNATFEISQQIFGSAAALARASANPLLDDLSAQRILTNVAGPLYAGDPQVIDGDVKVGDADSTNFADGQLNVNVVSGLTATDVLAIRNQGTGAGQIGVSGADVSYGGTVIGTFAGGSAGSGLLTVTFNSNANAAAVQALVENISYQNTAPPAGTTSRYIGFRLTDGDGGVSDPSVVQLTIQNAYTPPTVFVDDIIPSITFTETQAKAGVLVDDAVQVNYAGATGFANGHLVVSYLSSTNRVDDQLSIRNQGTGTGQVSVSGSDVLYQGVSIGTISATLNGVNGANLDITFKAAATDQAIERVIENLVYRNPSSGPLVERSISINVTDGASASGTARTVVIDITPETDPAGVVNLFGEQQTNTFEAGQQTEPAVARLYGANNGGYVIAWTSQGAQDGDGYGVFAQRYDAKGAAFGPEFQANTQTLSNQTEVAIAGLPNGGYVIVWRADNQDGSGSYGVYGQRYAADGSAAGAEFRANTTTTGNQYEPTVLGLSDGTFVVAYRSDYSDAAATYTYDVLAQRFAADGSPLGAEITLNTTGGATQYQPKLTALSGGGYVAVWSDTSGDASGYGIGAQVFANDGSKVGGLIAVNTTVAGTQYGADVAGLAGGGFVAVWDSGNSVFAQLFNAAGAKVGGELAVNTSDSPSNQSDSIRVAALDGGGFIVTWDGYPSASLGGSSQDVMAQQFDASGNKIDGVKVVDTTTASTQYLPDIVGLTGSNAVVAWAGYDQERGTQDTYGVFHQILGTAGSIVNSAAPLLVDVAPSLSLAENLVNATPQLIDAGVSLTDSDSANFDGGRLWVSVISGYGNIDTAQLSENVTAQDQLGIRNQGNGTGQVGVSGSVVSYGGTAIGSIVSLGANGADLVLQFNANASADAVEAVIENLTYANTSSAPVASRTVSIVVSDGDGGTSIPRTVTINVTPEADGAQPLFGNEQVNTYVPGTQQTPEMARLSDGGYITVWASDGQDGWGYGIYAQRFDAKGVAAGTEFRINSYTPNAQSEPVVAALTGGGYVVAWRSEGQDGSSAGVYAQRFANDGTLLGSEFLVNSATDNGQFQPNIAATADGGFVVAWGTDYYNSSFTEYRDIYFQRYNAAGVAQGGETQANPGGESTVTQSQPNIVGLSGGGFVTVWTDDSKDGSSQGIYGQRFNADSTVNGASFRVNTFTTSDQSEPDMAALNDGGFVVVWTSYLQDGNGYGVFAQRYTSAGATVGSEFRVNTSTSGNQSDASVAALSHGGFVVTWLDGGKIVAQQFDVGGARLDGELRVDTADVNYADAPSVIGLTNGAFAVSWRDYDAAITNYNIYQQIFGNPADFVRQANPVLVDVAPSVTFGENAVNAAPQLIDPVVGLSDVDSPDFNGGLLEVNYLTGYDLQNQLGLQGLDNQDQLGIRHQGNGAGQIGVSGNTVSYGGTVIGTIVSNGVNGAKLAVQLNTNATPVAVERLIENLTYANPFSDASLTRTVSIRVTDGDGGASVARSVVINITPEYDGAQPLFGNEQVNTYVPGTQHTPEMARLSDGSYITVWASDGQDGWGNGLYAQRFDAKGVPVGTEFQVNSYTPNAQSEPVVAALTGGGYVVAWRSEGQDGSSAGVYAQRFANDGTLLGSEFLVNSATDNGQYQPNIAATADGGFVVAWGTDYYNSSFTEYRDIYFQRYNAAGVAQGGETQANPGGESTVTQSQPNIVGLSGGGFVTVWTDDSKDGSGAGVYGQRFNADGTVNGASFLVNTYTTNPQSEPDMAALNDGGFVVVWTSNVQDGSSAGVFAQRYTSAGATVGSEFRVNTSTSGNQSEASVAALSHGGFVVTWLDGGKIVAQQFDVGGARLDGELRVDTADVNYADAPSVIGLTNGAFAVSWGDYDAAITNYNIYQQIFGNPADFVRQANPVLVDVSPSVTFGENTLNALPQVIDPGVGLIDPDSANFSGGSLEVNYLTDYGAQDQLGLQGLDNQDQLGIRNQGTGAHQIGVSGNTISYGGTAIGTIVSNGANGDKLTVQFNANATADAVEHVIENLTYANTVSNPIASRTVSIRVTDGDGGASEPRNVVINVTPETDGAVRYGLEKVVNTTVASNQAEPSVARLSDGGYVVVWEDQGGADGSSYGVYGQRYDVNDNAVGAQFRANNFTTGNQYDAQVTGLNGGGFVVVWRGDNQDGSGTGVYGQRYDAAGVKAGGEFLVNTSTDQNQYQPSIAATADGGFVVAWYDDYYTDAGFTEYQDIFFQRYNATGVAQGAETRANPTGEGTVNQSEPSIAALTGGGFVTLWTDASKDGSGAGVYAQRFAADGAANGGVLQVNSFITGAQHTPSVTGLKDGGFIAVWQSEGQDLSSTGIYGQRFDAAGAKVGAEFRVNTNINGQQYEPAVTALENGGWVVSWTDTSSTTYDVYVQQYNAAGQQVDGETRVNTYTPYVQYQPSIASMADGGFVVAYAGYIYSSDQTGDGIGDGGNDTYEIRLQRFSNTAPNVSNVTATGAEESVIVLSNTLFEGGFVDPDGQSLQAIKIITLPAEGTLRLNNVAVTTNQEISLADLQAGALTYQGGTDYFGPDEFRWTGSDGIAFASTPVVTNILLSNVNDGPRLGALSNANGSEGSVFSRTLTIGDPDPEGHQITVDWGDGSPVTPFSTSSATPQIQHVYADNGTYAVQVTVNDQQGQPNSVESTGFTGAIANVAPTITMSGNNTVEQGLVYTLDLNNPSDPGADTVDQYSIDWGDGTAAEVYTAATLPVSGIVTHTYSATGAKTIVVGLRDEDGTYASAGSKNIVVSAPAEVITVDAGEDATVNEGTFFTRNIAFTDPTDQGSAGRTYTVVWGDGQTSNGFISAGASNFNISHTYADNGGPFTVTVTVDDSDVVQQQGSDSFVVNVNNVAPTVGLGGAGSVNEGSSYVLTLNPSDLGTDTITQYTIHWGDGVDDTVLAANLPADRQLTHTYADGNANPTITVDVIDEDSSFTNVGLGGSVFVVNVAPTAPVTGNDTAAEGSVYTLNVGAVSDPGSDTRNGYSINWGDGTPTDNFTPAQWAAALAAGGNFTHTFADGVGTGTSRTINVTTSDEDGPFTLGSKAITVSNVAPIVVLDGNAATNEGAVYTLNIVGSDVAGTADPLTYTINWGDGSAVQNLTTAELAAVAGNVAHTFADDQDGPANATLRTISVTVNDGDGGSNLQTKDVTVNNVAPTAAVTGADTVNEGSVYTLSVAAVTDPGTDTRTGYSIAWGDGSTSNFTPAEWTSAAGSFSHTYADGAASPTITVSATDEDGTFTLGTKAITVNNVAPALALAGAGTINEGASYTLNIVGSDVAGAADPLTYTINWGDGSAVQNLTAAELAAVAGNVAHTFADDQDGPANATLRTISVTVNDGDGGSTLQTKDVTVNNVAPTIALSGASTIETGQTYTLNLGAVTDPGTDTVSSYIIDWGDGSAAQAVGAAGNVTHTFASAGDKTISVSLVDEDGTFANAGSLGVTVGTPSATVSLEAGGDAVLDEGATFARTINFTDGTDNGAAGWAYSIDYGDGSAVVSGSTLVKSIDLSHMYADGDHARTVSVTVTDVLGESASDSFQVTVNNVAPTAAVTGADTVNEGSVYTLSVAAVTDPGTDTRTGYSIAWGDGSTSNFTPAEWTSAAGSFSHTYADGAASPTITVSATDEDDTFTLGTKAITVNNVAPALALAGAGTINEGASYTLNIVGSDVAGAADPLTYTINWGDGSAVQNLTAAELAAVAGNVAHTFADDQDGPANATLRTISVTVNDGDGGSNLQTKDVTVNNVAPTATLSGADTVEEGSAYTLNLGAITDPGLDTVTSYLIHWGDGSSDAYSSAGTVTHVYADGTGDIDRTISLDLVDEDGTYLSVASKDITVKDTSVKNLIHLGDATGFVSFQNPNVWERFWKHSDVAIEHKANLVNAGEAWTPATFNSLGPVTLSGGDLYAGDLGVSGQNQATSTIRQEIQGAEALRFNLDDPATKVTLNLSKLFQDDDANLLNYNEAGRLQALDDFGKVVAEVTFTASGSDGRQTVTLEHVAGFSAVVLTAGAYDDADEFVFGAYVDDGGIARDPYSEGGKLHGSDFLVHNIEFEVPVIGVPIDTGI